MNKEKFKQLQQDLIKHHIDCEGNACTSHPIFCVQTKKIVWGVDEDNDWDVQEVYDSCNCESYESILDYIKNQDEGFDKEHLENLCDYLSEEVFDWENCHDVIKNELEACSWYTEKDIVDFFNDSGLEIHMCYGKTVYEDVDFLLTRAEAEKYIDRWSYKLNSPRIYVKSMWQNNHMRDFIEAIMNGDIVWNDHPKTTS